MGIDNLQRRLDRIERRIGTGPSGFGRTPALWIVTRSDEDRAQQLAALTAAGEYQPDRLLIEWRVIKPEGSDHELRRPTPSSRPH